MLNLRLFALALLSVLLSAQALLAQSTEPFRVPADRAIDVLHIRLDLDVSLEEQSVQGVATLDFSPNRELSSVALDAVDLKVSRVDLINKGENNRSLEFENTGKELTVRFPEPLSREKESRIEIAYSLKEPRSGLHFFKPTETEPETPWMVWSQGEPEANRFWFPCFDRPNERQTTELIVRVDSKFTVLSNGKLIKKQPIEDGKRMEFHWKQEKPHVSYLVTLVVGEFAIIEETWRGKPVTYYVAPEREQDARRTFGRTLEMLDFFSEKFGIEYPWEKYAQVVVEQFTSGGMENTSATTLYDAVMHDSRALIDSSPDWLIAHELGHQWWGDLVTCRDWSHLWLNEGFATYCEVLWAEHKEGKDERDFLLYRKSKDARTGSTEKRPIVDRRYPSPGSMFDDRAYPKGGWVLHMLRSQLGDADFFRGLKRYGLEYAYRTAETSDLRKSFERLYGISLERFFYDWTERKGHPKLMVKTTYQADDGFVRIEIQQTQEDEAFHFPLAIELTGAGEGGEPVSITANLKQKTQTLFVPVKSRPAMVRVDPEYTVLAEINEEKSRDWWVAQLREGPTVPERLRAVEHFAKTPKSGDREVLIAALKEDAFHAVRSAAATALGKTKQSDAKAALIAASEETHPKARRSAIDALGQFEGDEEAAALLKSKWAKGDESYYVEAAVVEALAKICEAPPREILTAALEKESHRDVIRSKALDGLSRCSDEEALTILETWTERGRSRASRMSAIRALSLSLKKHEFPQERERAGLKLLVGYLKEPGPRIRRAALQALTEIPDLAQNERERIADISENDADGRVRDAARQTIKKLDEAKATSPQVQKLQSELDKLKEQYEKLEKQIENLAKPTAAASK